MAQQLPSIHHLFLRAAFQIHTPQKTFLSEKRAGVYTGITYAEAYSSIKALAGFLYDLGLEKGDRVAIIHNNAPAYLYIDQALMMLGLVNVSIYPTITEQETAYILNDAGCKALFIGSPFLLKKFEKVKDQCKTVEQVVLTFENESESYHLFNKVLAWGAEAYEKHLEAIQSRFASVEREDLATLIYTSGTTGNSKGAMLTHHNFMSNAEDAVALCPSVNEKDKFLSFLPLSHVYERLVSYILALHIGAEIAYAESIEKVAQNFAETQPTLAACVPRVLEKVEFKISQNAAQSGAVKKAIFNWAIRVGRKKRLAQEQHRKVDLFTRIGLPLAEKLVFSKIKQRLGGRIKLIVSGGGALPVYVGEFFGNIGIKVQEGYGLTETSPFICVNEYHRQVFGTVGRIAPSQEVAIQDIETKEIITLQNYHSFSDDYACREGEILVKGPNVMKGYWNKVQETAEVFDEEGWFHTGDIGCFEKGYLKITDRLKNMLKTSLGKNIFPTPIENVYLQSPKIEQVFIIGDKREYVTAIIVPSKEVLERAFNLNDDFFMELNPMIEDERIKSWLLEDIKQLSNKLAKYERIKDFVIKRNPFSLEANEMTVTQKQKRKVIETNYRESIELMYN
jgi:long-chain acyl-CoA synthetase